MNLLMFLSSIIFTFSFVFTQIFHPLALGSLLIIQCSLICLISTLSTFSSWFSYILFLIYMGAMLVLFIYVATLASNEMFKFSWAAFHLTLLYLSSSFLYFFIDPILCPMKLSISPSSFNELSYLSSHSALIAFVYNFPSANITIFIVFYLLLTLVVVIQISYNYAGALRFSS
uniref:NADH dehydrogenase subunit 6 n=1 Tax=Rhynchocinetes brucei TaxID=1531312 RepID=UPI0026E220A3|nr:NADH dehydrogenase subunit 6 [Rhynchocinetes brucei]WJM99853.1 NADH dehydrogenase subunit 6 [Rhynchocinetes brucei]